jgi:2-polyprenyl-6-methoxyphenol hydroxylase-like FAD-dependent oxidoreductase
LDTAVAEKISAGAIETLSAPIKAFHGAIYEAVLADGATRPALMLIDTQRPAATSIGAQPNWRREAPASGLSHDYRTAALVGVLQASHPHGFEAQQIFLPDGPLALLPLPQIEQQADRVALVWSLPRARAAALAAAPPNLVAHELAQATQNRFGTLCPQGPLATQDLHLYLAEQFMLPTRGAPIVLLGEAAHVIHPLAGQGFNLTLRDAAQLAETLYETKRLGLALGDATMLADYAVARQRAAFEMASTTHALDALFGRPAGAALGRLGLAMTQMLAERNPVLRRVLRARANGSSDGGGAENRPHGGPAEPRLLRGLGY